MPATLGDMKTAQKKILKIKAVSTLMVFNDLGDVCDWLLVSGDAGIKSLPDKVTSVGGQVILLSNRTKNKTCVLLWRLKKILNTQKSC